MHEKVLSSDWLVKSTAVLNKFVTRMQTTNGTCFATRAILENFENSRAINP